MVAFYTLDVCVIIGIDHPCAAVLSNANHPFESEVAGFQRGWLLIDQRIIGIRFLCDLFYRGAAVKGVNGYGYASF
ncbi:hypothetical protein SDC9_150425 [bioreactor metagenome]|uniref:Uncharacterized protein n=1 Tax=bioreactor metagenome TaxID=1076179 RepID=A0A645EPX1_9ZZZZ